MATRVNKYLSEVGYCSRRVADKLIEEGKVTINGKVPEIGTKVDEGDQVEVSFNLSSKEFNGRYFHNIDAWRIENLNSTETNETNDMPEFNAPATEEDDLPF